MTTYSHQDIEALITCPKTIMEPPRREMRLERGSRRNEMRLLSEDGEKEFTVFMRVNERFPENFSIGVYYHPKSERGSVCLLRCNGPHGDFVGAPGAASEHFLFHIHKAKPENIEAGLRAERGGEQTDAYASYEQALLYFLRVVHVVNSREYFPEGVQLPLSFPEGEKNNELP